MSRHRVSLDAARPLTMGDEKASDIARQLHSMVQQLSASAVHSGAENHVHVLLILAQAANGLLHLLARASMPIEEEKDPVSSTAALFAALLAYHTAPCEYEHGRVQAEFSPLVIFDALRDTEKMSGQQPDERLHPNMCRVARESAADPAIVAQINKARSRVMVGDATLN